MHLFKGGRKRAIVLLTAFVGYLLFIVLVIAPPLDLSSNYLIAAVISLFVLNLGTGEVPVCAKINRPSYYAAAAVLALMVSITLIALVADWLASIVAGILFGVAFELLDNFIYGKCQRS